MKQYTKLCSLLSALILKQDELIDLFAPYPSVGLWRNEAGTEYVSCTAQVFLEAIDAEINCERSKFELYGDDRLARLLNDIQGMIYYMTFISPSFPYHFELQPIGHRPSGPLDTGWSILRHLALSALGEMGETQSLNKNGFFQGLLVSERIEYLREYTDGFKD